MDGRMLGFIALAAFALLLAGCTGAPQNENTAPNGGVQNLTGGNLAPEQNATGGNGSTVVPPEVGNNTQTPDLNLTMPPENESDPEEILTGGDTHSGSDYAALLATNIPLSCTYSFDNGTLAYDLQMEFLNGKGHSYGTTTMDGVDTDFEAIYDGKDFYLLLDPNLMVGIFSDCDWLKTSGKAVGAISGSGTNLNVDPEGDFKSAKANYTCDPGTFDDGVFVPDGNVCDLDALMSQYGSTTYTTTGVCSGATISDPELILECNDVCAEFSGQDLTDCIDSYSD
jgi:hypothetical protein